MKKRTLNILLIFLSFVFTMPLQSQTQQLTLDDLIPGGKSYFRFVPKSIKQLQWMGDEYIFQAGRYPLAGPSCQEEVETGIAPVGRSEQGVGGTEL